MRGGNHLNAPIIGQKYFLQRTGVARLWAAWTARRVKRVDLCEFFKNPGSISHF
jgi:hypothetical protein